MNQATKKRLTDKVKACIRRANKMFDVKIPLTNFSLTFINDPDGVAYAWYHKGEFGIQLNEYAVNTNIAIIEAVIIPHEVAHSVMDYKQQVQKIELHAKDHGKEWRDICIALGGTGDVRCGVHTSPPEVKRDSEYYPVKTASGYRLHVTKHRYKMLKTGKKYIVPQTRELISKINICSDKPVKRSHLIEHDIMNFIRKLKEVA